MRGAISGARQPAEGPDKARPFSARDVVSLYPYNYGSKSG